MAITLTDLELRIIPNAFVLAGAIAGVVIVLGFDLGDLDERAIAVAAAGGALPADRARSTRAGWGWATRSSSR